MTPNQVAICYGYNVMTTCGQCCNTYWVLLEEDDTLIGVESFSLLQEMLLKVRFVHCEPRLRRGARQS